MINDSEYSVLELLNNANSTFSNETICKLSCEQKVQYEILLNKFKECNSNKNIGTKDKGNALEKLVTYLLHISGDLFEIFQNVKTGTNELDQLVGLSPKGKILMTHGILNEVFKMFICECKNYSSSVGVTYIGKLFSLMDTCDINFSILFSYHGVSGQKWEDASGLIRKIYMSNNTNGIHSIIIDFNFEDFEAILNGDNFLDIIEKKILSLKLDTDYSSYISTHPAASEFKGYK